MAEPTVLGGVIEFMGRIGVFDVILPFLLVFTIMYAILEKSKILGTEKWGKKEKEMPRKNLNAMAAFTVSFMVVASAQLVGIITAVSSKIVVLLFVVVFFLLLIGAFYGKGEHVSFKADSGWRNFFMVTMLAGVVFIFMDSITFEGGQTILEWVWEFIRSFWTSAAAASIIFVLLLLGVMSYITRGDTSETETSSDNNGDSNGNGND